MCDPMAYMMAMVLEEGYLQQEITASPKTLSKTVPKSLQISKIVKSKNSRKASNRLTF